jgi:hypothetical protein
LKARLRNAVGPLIVVAFAAGCGRDDAVSGDALASLDGTSWSLAEGAGVTIPDEVTMTVAFAARTASGTQRG